MKGLVMPIKTLGRLLKSKKLAVFLITIVTVASTLGMLVPQADKVFTSWWFLLISLVFFVNLLTCTWNQGLKAWGIWKKRKVELPGIQPQINLPPFKTTRDTFEKDLSHKGFRIINKAGNITIFEKGFLGIWGSVVIHVGLIIVILGAFISAGLKMTGYMTLMEGEVRSELGENYDVISEAPLFKIIGHRGYGIGLKKQNRVLNEEGKVDYIISDITLFEENRPIMEKPVERGKPLVYKGIGIYEKNAGFVPLVTITDSSGREIYQGFLFMESTHGLSESSGLSESIYQRKNFSVPGTSFVLNIRFYPDVLIEDNQISTRKFSLGNPGLEVTVTRDGQKLAQGVIKRGEKVIFAGNSLSFDEVRNWTGLEIVYDPGAGTLFAGLWVTGLGLILFFLCSYRKVQVKFETVSAGLQIEAVYYCLRNRKMFNEEIRALMNQLNSE
jgi:cytochrome c biogenesis protein